MLLRVCGWLLCSTINYAGSSWYSWWRPLWTSVSNNSLLRFLFEFKIASFAQDCQHTHSLHPSLAWPLEESVWENPWELGINGRITWLLVTQALESDHLSLSPGAPLLLCDLWWVFKPPLSLSYLICKSGHNNNMTCLKASLKCKLIFIECPLCLTCCATLKRSLPFLGFIHT